MNMNEKSKSEILHNQIIEKATNRYFNYHNNKDAIDNFLNDNKDLRNPKVIKNIIKRDSLKKLDSINKENEFEPILIELYQQCIEDDFYWQYCPLVVYKKYVNVKLKEYQLRNKGASEKSFFMDEISRVKDSAKETNLLKSKIVLYFDLFLDYTENIKMVVGEPIVFENDEHKNLFYNTQKEKIEYLNNIEIEKEYIAEEPIFTDELLTEFHKAFNKSGELWEEVELIPFIESWKDKGNKIKIKDKCIAHFCFAVGCLEEYRNKELYPNMDEFMQKAFKIRDYKGRKRINPRNPESSTSKKKYAIKRKIDIIIKQLYF